LLKSLQVDDLSAPHWHRAKALLALTSHSERVACRAKKTLHFAIERLGKMYPDKENSMKRQLISASTQAQYVQTLRRFAKREMRYFEDISAKSTGHVFCAALRWALETDDPEGGDTTHQTAIAEALAIFGGRLGAIDFLKHFSCNYLKKRVGRVKKLRGLPPDWCQQIVAATGMELPVEHASIIALAQTGCRPSEIEGLRMAIKHGRLFIVIDGKKIKPSAGQTIRGSEFAICDPLKPLVELCPSDGSVVSPFISINARRIERLLEKASNKVFGDPRRVNASTIRNGAASNLKFLTWSKSDIAKFLGHQSERTQKYYGRPLLGRRGSTFIEPVRVIAKTTPRPVKTHHLSMVEAQCVQRTSHS
jgi:integrase